MTPDLHPEDLIDRALEGRLDPGEQATLDHHLAGCVVCAAQVSLAPRFARELASQTRDPALDQRAIDAAMLRMQQSPARRVVPSWFRWAAAAALLAVGVTAGAGVIKQRLATRAPVIEPLPAPRAPVQRPAPRPAVGAVEAAPAEAPPPPEAPPAKQAHRPAQPAVTAADLFERAEQQRREGRVDGAIATYRRLQSTFPETAEAGLSYALAGQLLLKHGRASDALAQFDRSLKSDGAVGEEALVGRATALEQLHRTSEAVAAWKTFLARYPRSVYAERARARLAELNERR
jgi:TolA-binding protein